jgi:lipopolysaccharide transport system ATP-binding protein
MAGLTTEEVQACLPGIVSFSELGDYFDQPLRVYSTGMQMRLAFSCATIVRPDILIVDEALAVGDVYFQHKCIQRIRTITEQGATLLFVSHDPSAVKSLCQRALLLDQGQMLNDGDPETVLDYYNSMIARKTKDQEIRQVEDGLGRKTTRSGSGEAKIKSVELTDATGKPARAFCVGDIAKLKIRIGFTAFVENPTIGFGIRDRLGNDIFGTNSLHLKAPVQSYQAGDTLEIEYSVTLNLGCGSYSISVSVHSYDTHLADNYDWWDRCLVFQIVPGDLFHFVGTAALPVDVELHKEFRE